MRYSAATCDPNDFVEEGYTLRQVLYDPPRRTELFIVLTMYNEDEELFTRTMHGVMKNIAHLCTRDRSKTWGKDGWKKVVVCIVSDGRMKINSRTLSVIATMGCYQDGVAKVWLSHPLNRPASNGHDTESGKQQSRHRPYLRVHYAKYVLQTSKRLCHLHISVLSFCNAIHENRGCGERHGTRSGHFLSERKKPKENQLSPVVFQCFWAGLASTQFTVIVVCSS